MAPTLDSDVFYALVNQALALYSLNANIDAIINLSSTCRVLRETCLPVLFSDIHWPHANKHDEESGLHFFPPNLWPYFKFVDTLFVAPLENILNGRVFRRLQLLWPEEWPDATPPRWGDRFYIGGDYHPRHIDKLVTAIPMMPSLTSFHLCCPFFPPTSILNAVIQCSSLRELSIHETPLYFSMIPRVPPNFHLERIVLVPVGEAVRVGEGPYDARYAEPSYYFREYRKKYKNDVLARYAATALLFQLSKPTWLRYVQMSADLCNIDEFAARDWPRLETLVLTGHSPRGTAGIVGIVARMPRLTELRLLFSRTKTDQGFRVLPDHNSTGKYSPAVLGQLKYLALSNACNFDGVLHYATSLERLAVCAIIDQPRVPIALSRAEIDRMLEDMEIGQRSAESKLLRLRIMIEDKVNPALCHAIALHCPQLQALEIEICGYHDGKSIHAWVSLSSLFL
jgi:hypothetical protein